MTKKTYEHNPPYIFMDDAAYFITAAIYQKRPLLNNPELKTNLLQCIQHYFDQHQWLLQHWVILDNHYHLFGETAGIKKPRKSYAVFHKLKWLNAFAVFNPA